MQSFWLTSMVTNGYDLSGKWRDLAIDEHMLGVRCIFSPMGGTKVVIGVVDVQGWPA